MLPPTTTDSPYNLGPWLHRPAEIARTSKRAALAIIALGILAWVLFAAWACWTKPHILGPPRMITVLALVVVTATAGAVAWLAYMGELIWTTLTRLLMELATRNLMASITRTNAAPPAAPSGRLGVVEPIARR